MPALTWFDLIRLSKKIKKKEPTFAAGRLFVFSGTLSLILALYFDFSLYCLPPNRNLALNKVENRKEYQYNNQGKRRHVVYTPFQKYW